MNNAYEKEKWRGFKRWQQCFLMVQTSSGRKAYLDLIKKNIDFTNA